MSKKLTIAVIISILVLVGIIGYPKFKEEYKKSMEAQRTETEHQAVSEQQTRITQEESTKQTTSGTEKASGIIKSAYSKSGKNYIDIDYIELNPNWAPGGMSEQAYQNNNPKIRTFEISPNAKFIVGSPATDYITFSEFQKFFIDSNTTFYQRYNPWNIIITDDIVTEIAEYFLP